MIERTQLAPAYCPSCGRAQPADARFCSTCGHAFAPGEAGQGMTGATHQTMAQSMLYWQRLEWKLRAGRLVGVLAGIAVWWFIAGPLLGGNPITTFGAFFVLAFGGLWLGGQLVLESVAGGRR